MSSPAPSFVPGDVVADRYRVEEVIGAGGFGVVLRAREIRMDRLVALKVLRPGLLDSLEGVKRFEREAQLVQRLDHPGGARPVPAAADRHGSAVLKGPLRDCRCAPAMYRPLWK